MPDAPPTEFADVDQPFQPAEIDKRAEIAQVGDDALDVVAGAQARQDVGALAGLGARSPFGKDQAVLLFAQFDHAQRQRLADPRQSTCFLRVKSLDVDGKSINWLAGTNPRRLRHSTSSPPRL